MKPNKLEPANHRSALALAAVAGVAAIIVALAIGYTKLKDIWLEQCVITNLSEQVSITSGKMVKADVIAGELGLTNGANLALIDFKKKRKEILKKIPNLRQIRISRQLPAKITITTEERTPIARLNILQRKSETGKVVDADAMVFICQRGTQTLPTIREPYAPGTKAGQQLSGRALAALRLIETCRETEFAELAIQQVDISKRDYLLATLGNYSRAKIAWEGMDESDKHDRQSLMRQLRMLVKAVRTQVTPGTVIWNATDTSNPGRIYADVKSNL